MMNEASYQITEKDYVNSLALHGKMKPRLIVIIIMIAVAILALSLLWKPAMVAAVVGGIFGSIIALLVGRFILSPLMAKRHYRQYKAIHDTFTIQLMEEGVTFKSTTSKGITQLDSILKWRENNAYVLIYIMPRLYHIVPKSIADDGFDLPLLVDMLYKKVGNPL